jgi:quercetin dioxygenase-like cupin family protein
MRKSASCKLLFAFAAIGLFAQTPSVVKIDSEQATVTVVAVQPHQKSALEEHALNRVMIYLDGGEIIETATGQTRKLQVKAGEVHWIPAQGLHTFECNSDHPIRIVEIELKNNPRTPPTLSPIDPLKVDPGHYSLEFENDQVRVLRVRFGPHEEGVRHEHVLNHIVVYLNDQARGKTGDVRLDEPMTHNEQNILDHSVERIAVDLK